MVAGANRGPAQARRIRTLRGRGNNLPLHLPVRRAARKTAPLIAHRLQKPSFH